MVTIKDMNRLLQSFALSLIQNGYRPNRIILFGSYAKGIATKNSDIDVAVWSDSFSGNRIKDIASVAPVISAFRGIELHPFNSGDFNDNPFINEIEKTGIDYSHLIPE